MSFFFNPANILFPVMYTMPNGQLLAVAWSPVDEHRLAVGCLDGCVGLVDVRKPGELVEHSNVFKKSIHRLQFDPKRCERFLFHKDFEPLFFLTVTSYQCELSIKNICMFRYFYQFIKYRYRCVVINFYLIRLQTALVGSVQRRYRGEGRRCVEKFRDGVPRQSAS